MQRWLAATVLVMGCSGAPGGGGASGGRLFNPDWQSDGGESMARVQAQLSNATIPEAAPVAVGVTRRGLVGVGLDRASRWSHTAELDARPALAGSLVVATGGGSLFALDARSGKQLWKVASGGRALRGAGDDGSITVASLGDRTGGRPLLIAVNRSGKRLLEAAPGVETGNPAIVAGVAFVPWGDKYVSALEVESAKEIGRLLMREQVSHARSIGQSLYFGQRALVLFDAKIGQVASGGASKLTLPERELPGQPEWFEAGDRVLAPRAGARDKIRLYARPEPRAQQLGIDSNRFAATYFRIAIGFDATDAGLKWVRTFEHDLVGGAAASGGFALCDAGGNVWLLDAAGRSSGKRELGQPIEACVVEPGRLAVGDGEPQASLPEQIADAIRVREAEMASAQRFLLRELGAIEDPVVTKALIDIASDPRTPPSLLGDARQLLSSRRTGVEHMLEALNRQYDFLSDVLRPPPVGPLADALLALNERRAAPLLAKHLNDPANTPDDIERAARALAKLGSADEAEELRTFFALYRATADQKELVNAVLSVAEALLRVGGADGERAVRRAAEDPLTHPEVKRGIANLLSLPAKPDGS
jgi:outer membrane protein assembly factor BamB